MLHRRRGENIRPQRLTAIIFTVDEILGTDCRPLSITAGSGLGPYAKIPAHAGVSSNYCDTSVGAAGCGASGTVQLPGLPAPAGIHRTSADHPYPRPGS